MVICVDKLKESPWKYGKACHLFDNDPEKSGSSARLHYFARQIGLKNSYFQMNAILPHYDLSPSKRRAAVDYGAQEVSMSAIKKAIARRRA